MRLLPPTLTAALVAAALAGTVALPEPAGAARPPAAIAAQGVVKATLVVRLVRPEGPWRVWQGRDRDGALYGFLASPAADGPLAGGACPPLRKRRLTLCLWGRVGGYEVALGRASGRVRSLVALNRDGEPVPMARANGVYLALSHPDRTRAVLLVGRDRAGKVIVRRRIASAHG